MLLVGVDLDLGGSLGFDVFVVDRGGVDAGLERNLIVDCCKLSSLRVFLSLLGLTVAAKIHKNNAIIEMKKE